MFQIGFLLTTGLPFSLFLLRQIELLAVWYNESILRGTGDLCSIELRYSFRYHICIWVLYWRTTFSDTAKCVRLSVSAYFETPSLLIFELDRLSAFMFSRAAFLQDIRANCSLIALYILLICWHSGLWPSLLFNVFWITFICLGGSFALMNTDFSLEFFSDSIMQTGDSRDSPRKHMLSCLLFTADIIFESIVWIVFTYRCVSLILSESGYLASNLSYFGGFKITWERWIDAMHFVNQLSLLNTKAYLIFLNPWLRSSMAHTSH